VTDSSGGVRKRYDYLPFGEELASSIGSRSAIAGYTSSDSTRQLFTSKERDNETGLDYFFARYYSSAQGRFTSVDLAGPSWANPQTLNKYQYALNNPFHYIDRNGLYEEDVHRDLTTSLAYAAGFSMEEAKMIGFYNQDLDDNHLTAPVQFDLNGQGYRARRNFHFTTEARRQQMWGYFESAALTLREEENMQFDVAERLDRMVPLLHLGTYFHAAQDFFSHLGFGPRIGHLLVGHRPDKTYNNVPKANLMAIDTYQRLVKAGSLLGKTSTPVPYGIISRLVNAFNAATTMQEKRVRLTIINWIVTVQRRRLEEPIKAGPAIILRLQPRQ